MRTNKKVLSGILLFILFFSFSVQAFAGNPPDGTQTTLVATSPGSGSAVADGIATASFTVTLKDAGGIALVGDSVTLAIPTDPDYVLTPSTTTTNGSGQAVFTISSTHVGTFSIDVKDITTSTTLLGMNNVTFTSGNSGNSSGSGSSSSNSGSGQSSCTAVAPISAPDLYQVNTTKTTATLFFAQPPTGGFDGYDIFYGLSESADSYSVHFQQGSSTAANKYTINSLTPYAIYYFRVRADNGCAPGPWSATRKSNYPASALTKLPATGPADTLLQIGIGGAITALVGLTLVFVL